MVVKYNANLFSVDNAGEKSRMSKTQIEKQRNPFDISRTNKNYSNQITKWNFTTINQYLYYTTKHSEDLLLPVFEKFGIAVSPSSQPNELPNDSSKIFTAFINIILVAFAVTASNLTHRQEI